jgi:hypothetical protein
MQKIYPHKQNIMPQPRPNFLETVVWSIVGGGLTFACVWLGFYGGFVWLP